MRRGGISASASAKQLQSNAILSDPTFLNGHVIYAEHNALRLINEHTFHTNALLKCKKM